MHHRPRFKPHFRVESLNGEGVLLLSEVGQSVLRGRLHELVAPLIDGQRSADDIVTQVRGQADLARVYFTLAELERKGFLCESDDGLSTAAESAWWTLQDIEPRTAARRLAETTVSVTAVGDVSVESFQAALDSLHVRVGASGQLAVVLTDDYLRSGLEACNREALDSGQPWLLVKPVGCQVWIGPLFRPGRTGCWACLAQRLRNRPAEILVQEKQVAEPVPVARGCTAATLQIAWNLAATEVAKWLARGGESSELEGKLLTLDSNSWQTQTHTLVRLPQCPACGRPQECLDRLVQPVVLESRKKTFTQDGGHRSHSPEETLKRYQHHVSPITGAVSMLEPSVPPGDGVMHVYVAGENYSRRRHTLEDVRRDLRSSSSGKGMTDVQAKASGLCEALERFSGVFRGDEPRRQARLKELGPAGIHPNACMLYSARQFDGREDWNAGGSRWNHVPAPFDEEAEVEWSPVWSLTRQEVRYLPTAFCYYDHPRPPGGPYCFACSNGNAAGNTLEEAILQGFLELVERDAVALWWYNRVQRPAVALDSFGEPYLQQLAEYLHHRQRDLWVLDLTTDLQIPVFVALSRRTAGEPEAILLGFGAHLDPRIALLRAVTELNQMLAWILPAEGEHKPLPLDDTDTLHWLRTATLANQPYLAPDAGTPPRVASQYPRQWTDDLRDDVLFCRSLLERHGMEMLVLDQTRADIGLPVVKVIVPGLRHFSARFAPGRLYDVPVRLGWLPQPLGEEQLNPIPMFI